MTDPLDIASEQEQLARDIAIDRQRQIGALAGKTIADSAQFCENDACGVAIPTQRRAASPGCRYCIDCQGRIERNARSAGKCLP